MKKYSFLLLFLCQTFLLQAQLTDSNLPIVIITSQGGGSVPDHRVPGAMKVIYNTAGERNYVADQNDVAKLNYNGAIRIETRGSSSQSLPKKQYAVETVLSDNVTNNNVSLLGLPKENDWVLNGLAFDASLIRDYITYNLSAKLGNYAPRQRYCEVILNGAYVGLYILQEKIKIDDGRVNISKVDPSASGHPGISGGYLVKADKITPEDPAAWAMPTHLGTETHFVLESPDYRDATNAQLTYIQSVFTKLQSVASNASVSNGYPSVIDVPSFVDFMLISELSANVDAYQFSTFFHKDRNGKLRAGPVWDSNLTFGNDLTFWGLDRSKTNTWQFDNGDNVGPRFWLDLYNNSTFRCYLSRRWSEVTAPGQPLNEELINTFIDETVSQISEAVVRENNTWGTIGNHAAQVQIVKSFIASRIPWITTRLGGSSACTNIPVPSLVISRIHYHPLASDQFPDAGDLEFIEIVNNGSASVDLTGLYFSGTGFVYRFPGVTIEPNDVIQLANDRNTFEQKYGYAPFGEFTRNLDNDSQKLTLADAFGNLIDEVEYSDDLPWPDADGNGMYLKLQDLTLNNDDGANWVVTDEAIASTVTIVGTEGQPESTVKIFPNPSDATFKVTSPEIIETIEIVDLQGRRHETIVVQDTAAVLDLSRYSAGIYVLKIRYAQGATAIDRVVKR
jgi:hypothetical protein